MALTDRIQRVKTSDPRNDNSSDRKSPAVKAVDLDAGCVETKLLRMRKSLRISVFRSETDGFAFVAKHIVSNRIGRSRHESREILLARELQHSRIIKVFNVIDEEKFFEIRMHYVEKGNLQDVLDEEGVLLNDWRSAVVADQILAALEYLNAKAVVHRDIKPSNILVYSWTPLSICLADFGMACYSADGADIPR